MVPLFSSVTSIFFDKKGIESDSYDIHEERLKNILHAWGMERHIVPGDGNCCFSAIAFALITNTALINTLIGTVDSDNQRISRLHTVARRVDRVKIRCAVFLQR